MLSPCCANEQEVVSHARSDQEQLQAQNERLKNELEEMKLTLEQLTDTSWRNLKLKIHLYDKKTRG